MKKLLFVFALSLSSAITARSQEKAVEFRTGDALVGHIKSARTEMASFSLVDGALVEGPRHVIKFITYSPDGKRRDVEHYAPDGSVQGKLIFVYDDSGKQMEQLQYDGRNNPISRTIFRFDAGEMLEYGGNGTLMIRTQVIWNEKHEAIETKVYDGNGGLLRRRVKTRDAGKLVWRTYRADGSLKEEAVHSLNDGGPHHIEERDYNPDGSISGRRVSDVDARANNQEVVEENGDGTLHKKTRVKREYDAHGNLSKFTMYVWNIVTHDYVPISVFYNVIDYYD